MENNNYEGFLQFAHIEISEFLKQTLGKDSGLDENWDFTYDGTLYHIDPPLLGIVESNKEKVEIAYFDIVRDGTSVGEIKYDSSGGLDSYEYFQAVSDELNFTEYKFEHGGNVSECKKFAAGGFIFGSILGGYVGYKIGRSRPQKLGFSTEKEIAKKAAKKASAAARRIKSTAKEIKERRAAKKSISTMAKGGNLPKHDQKRDMEYKSEEDWEKRYKRKTKAKKHPSQMKSGGEIPTSFKGKEVDLIRADKSGRWWMVAFKGSDEVLQFSKNPKNDEIVATYWGDTVGDLDKTKTYSKGGTTTYAEGGEIGSKDADLFYHNVIVRDKEGKSSRLIYLGFDGMDFDDTEVVAFADSNGVTIEEYPEGRFRNALNRVYDEDTRIASDFLMDVQRNHVLPANYEGGGEVCDKCGNCPSCNDGWGIKLCW